MASGECALTKRLDIASGHRRLDEDSRDFARDKQRDGVFDVLDSGFRLGAYALNADYGKTVAPAKVIKSVMGGNQDFGLFRNAVQHSFAIPVKLGKAGEVPVGVRTIKVPSAWVVFDKTITNHLSDPFPGNRIHPDMRICVSAASLCGEQIRLFKFLCNCINGFPRIRNTVKSADQFTFKKQPVVKDDVRVEQEENIGSRRLKKVRVYPRSHHREHLDAPAGDPAHSITDHAGSGDDTHGRFGLCRRKHREKH